MNDLAYKMEEEQKIRSILTLLSFLTFYASKVRNYSHCVDV